MGRKATTAAGQNRNAHGQGAEGETRFVLDPGGQNERFAAGKFGNGCATMFDGGERIALPFASAP